jgi:rRNA maturation protein Nop10
VSTIRTTCPACGTVDLAAGDVTLHMETYQEGAYVFRCPDCGAQVERPAPTTVAGILAGAGVEVVYRPLDVRDLVALRRLLDDDAAIWRDFDET